MRDVIIAAVFVLSLAGPVLVALFVEIFRVIPLQKDLAEMEGKIRRIQNCPRCYGTGSITDRHGDLDECPGCHGGGRRLLPGDEW